MALSEILRRLRGPATVEVLREKIEKFRDLVDKNNQVLELMADAGEKLGGEYIFDRQYLVTLASDLERAVGAIVEDLNAITDGRYAALSERFSEISTDIRYTLDSRVFIPKADFVIPLDSVDASMADITGQKMARLGEIKKSLGITVPAGFVISTHAGRRFLEETGIAALAERYFEDPDGGPDLAEKSEELVSRVKNADPPGSLERAIRRGVERLKKHLDFPYLAVRSSATDEDGEMTFAGQYKSLLGVSPEMAVEAYKEVLSSLFSAGVMNYRKNRGLHPARGGMAVGVMGMVDAVSAGVAYSLSPIRPEANILSVAASVGLGKTVVDGSGETDSYEVSRLAPHPVVARRIGEKLRAYATRPGMGLVRENVSEKASGSSSVNDGALSRLAVEVLRIERFMKCAQDVEWALDSKGRMFILQARPLYFQKTPGAAGASSDGLLQKAVESYPVLMKNLGEVACRGIASGVVHILKDEDPPEKIPLGAVLAARTSTPRLASALARVGAVLTDVGTATGHLAAIAREYRVPAIMDMQVATRVLKNGMEVTVDAEENVVYQGRVPELLDYQILRSSSFEDKPEFRLLRRILKKTAPLNLKDPASTSFSPASCRTYHDIIRFAHEKAVAKLTEGYSVRPSPGSHVFRLDLDIPLDLVLIDLGGAVKPRERGKGPVGLGEVSSAPLLALLKGMTAKGAWITSPADMDLNGFMASATRSFSLTGPAAPKPVQNLAIVSERYLNLNLKLGYHFNIVDAYVTERRNDNYIYFRFAGGVTESARRIRRAVLLKKILEHYDFMVERKADLIIARIKKIPLEEMHARLSMLGRLIGFSRQLDIYLREDSLVEHYLESFTAEDPKQPIAEPITEKGETMSATPEVLVLDDEPIVCERLKDYLEKNDYKVEAFTVSNDAISRLSEKAFDVVVTDLKMKGPNGLDVLHFVRKQGRGTQVIIITGYATSETAREAEYTGVFGFIDKPFQMDALGAMVKKAAKKAAKEKGGQEKGGQEK